MRGRAGGEAEVGGPGGGPVPGPAGGLPVEHPQLVVHAVRGHLVVRTLLLGRGDVPKDSVD